MTHTLQHEIKDGIAIIRFNRPDVFNSFNREMALGFQELLDQCGQNDKVRAIYLTGNGKAFCAGQDLAEVTASDAPFIENIVAEHYNPIVRRIREIEKPIICAVNGVAAGAGANLALACDIVVATETASFIQAFSKIGLIPDSGGTFFLPKLIGFQKASALMMMGDKVSATDAEKMGMIYKVFSTEEFDEESMKIAQTISKMPTLGLVYTKKLLNTGMTNNLKEQLDQEEIYQSKAGKTVDYNEGVQAFLEKRKPKFVGK
ncbi:2-(1,2-epoxy-1,2-dihydrophenyl)acetyl-CoA isomerase [Reichenbachiella faecimaris]|uniref:2-(1,2-epoxy-1,2-dihydrophenyl)acetyl-CoA isomerase n=1 Tax=Reichenbachiella faecimaris TaxID=692418 RepID=A0A1W2G680_REIFA|nr:enoyl-CoA hydratase-related protein [Reichenbachiella faecimaris]SMD32123.1 2-(1,2-epoxy-1,2-dihydrophenyl)acetyl-CoA isomerase [Reichenbachiella faecimaris]